MAEDAEIEQLQEEADDLRARIAESRQAAADTTLADEAQKYNLQSLRIQIRCRKTLRAHWGKIYCVHWSTNSRNVVSASQDGKLIVWDGFTGNKRALLPLKSIWVMTCAYSPSGNFIASGGLDNCVSIYCLKTRERKVQKELHGHDAYISNCRFLDDNQILSSSGDKTCVLWDTETGQKVTTYSDPVPEMSGGVLSFCLSPDNRSFVTGDTINQARLWDLRDGTCKQTFETDDHVNAVSYFPSGYAFGTGSDDATCRLFDIRSLNELGFYGHDDILAGVTSVAFSKSGRVLFGGYDDFTVQVWDVLRQERVGVLTGHENRVSSIGVSEDGKCLCTGSWDSLVKLWN